MPRKSQIRIAGPQANSAATAQPLARRRESAPSSTMRPAAGFAVNRPHGADEQEADRTAAQVMQRLDQGMLDQGELTPQQRPAQPIQRREAPSSQTLGGGEISEELGSSITAAKGGGQALSPGFRSKMEQAFGTQFDGVRVHSDYQSHRLNRSLGARAFTTGQDIFFKRGEYNPSSREGQSLLAHELTHVTQQRAQGSSRGLIQCMGDEAFEKELQTIISNIKDLLNGEELVFLRGLCKNKLTVNSLKGLLYNYAIREAEDFEDAEDIKKELKGTIQSKMAKKQKEESAKSQKKANFSDESQKAASQKSKPSAADKRAEREKQMNLKKVESKKSKKDILHDVNEEDISVAQGFFNVEHISLMVGHGLQTDGVGSCTAVGIANARLTTYAYSHFDGEADFDEAIKAMIEKIDEVSDYMDVDQDEQPEKKQSGYYAWIAAQDTGQTMVGVEKALKKNKNIKQIYKPDLFGGSQFRFDPHEKDIDKKLKETKQKGASAVRYRQALIDANELPFGKNKGNVDYFRQGASIRLSALFESFVKTMTDNKKTLLEAAQLLFPNSANGKLHALMAKTSTSETLTAAEMLAVMNELLDYIDSEAFDPSKLLNPQDKFFWLENAKLALIKAVETNSAVYMSAVQNALTQF